MSSRISILLAVLLLILSAGPRLWQLTTLPPGLNSEEIIEVRIVETAREGAIEVFYDLGEEGREGSYHIFLAAVTLLTGNGTLGYRIVSVWASMIALALVYAVGRRLIGAVGGLSAMALLAFSFWPVLLGRSIAREALLPAVMSAVLLLIIVMLPIYRRRRRRSDHTSAATALGAILALGLYIHPVGLLIIAFSMIFITYMVFFVRRMSRRRMTYISFTLMMLIVLSMPYMISSLRMPQLGGTERLTGDQAAPGISNIIDGAAGLFIQGDPSPLHNLPDRPLFDPVSGLLIIVGLVVAARGYREPRYMLLLIAAAVLAPVYLLADTAPNFKHFASSLPLLALFFGIGVNTLIQRLPRHRPLAVVGALSALVIFNGVWMTGDLFERWPDNPETRAAYDARLGGLAAHIDRTAGEIPTIVCGWWLGQSPTSTRLSDVQLIDLMRNRRDANLRYVDCRSSIILARGGEPQQIILPNPDRLEELHPTVRAWLDDAVEIENTGRWDDALVMTLETEQRLADIIGQFTVTTPASYAPEVGGSREERINTPINFGGNLTFLGYETDESLTYQPGDQLALTTYWRIDGRVPPDLRFFTHILSDPGASPPANTDTISAMPRLLRNRDVVLQVTYVPLPSSLPPGQYQVSIGAYQDTSDARLNVLYEGEPRGTRLFLYDITITTE